MIVDRVRKKLKRELTILNIKNQNFHKTPPILVYQSGKVGSSTVVDSLLAANLVNPVYHIHCLASESLKIKGLAKPKMSKALRSKLDENSIKEVNWKIISLTRDPIAIAISALFQAIGIGKRNDLLQADGQIDVSLVFEELYQNIAEFDRSQFCNWFDRELNTVFGVDAFAYPFDCDLGYTIIQQDNVDVLIIRLEDLNNCGSEALARFLDLDEPVSLVQANVGNQKKYADTYKYIKKNISVPLDMCEKVYSSKYANHFYSHAQRKKFIDKWTGKKLKNRLLKNL